MNNAEYFIVKQYDWSWDVGNRFEHKNCWEEVKYLNVYTHKDALEILKSYCKNEHKPFALRETSYGHAMNYVEFYDSDGYCIQKNTFRAHDAD